MNTQQMLDRRTAGGADLAKSRELLADLLRRHQGDNLVAALVHQGFATERQAEAFLAVNRPTNWDDLGSSTRDLYQERIFGSMARRLERATGRTR